MKKNAEQRRNLYFLRSVGATLVVAQLRRLPQGQPLQKFIYDNVYYKRVFAKRIKLFTRKVLKKRIIKKTTIGDKSIPLTPKGILARI
jgi:hypothetical protein